MLDRSCTLDCLTRIACHLHFCLDGVSVGGRRREFVLVLRSVHALVDTSLIPPPNLSVEQGATPGVSSIASAHFSSQKAYPDKNHALAAW
jgi:hypothetical protein